MDDLAQSRTASVLTILLGIWLALSPIWIALSGAGAVVSLYIVAGIMILFGLVQLFTENSSPSWVVSLASVWLFISAFVLSVSGTAAWNQALTAIVAFVLAIWDGAEITHVHQTHHPAGAM